jgi:hypothetical protein
MSQANFMRNVRMTMPQYVTNVTSFSDTVKILKNKGILTENQDKDHENVEPSDDELEAMIKKIEDEKAGEEAVNAQHDLEEELPASHTDLLTAKKIVDKYYEMFGKNPQTTFADVAKALGTDEEHVAVALGLTASGFHEGINEAKERKGSSGKEQYSKFTDAQKENFQELTLGIKIEHECFPDKTYEEITKIVLKNIKKEPLYYTHFKLTGIRDYKPESMDHTNTPEVMAMKPVKDGNLVDTKRGMTKVKMPKVVKEAMEVDQAGNLNNTPDEKRIEKLLSQYPAIVAALAKVKENGEWDGFFNTILNDTSITNAAKSSIRAAFQKALDQTQGSTFTSSKVNKNANVPGAIFNNPFNAKINKGINDIGGIKEAEQASQDVIEKELAKAISRDPQLKRVLQKVDLPNEINGTIKALLDRTNLKNIPDGIVLAALRKVLAADPGPSFTAQYAANKNIGKPLKEKLTALVREILAEEEAPSKKKAAEEITAKAIDAIDDHNEGEGKGYKKKWLENVFDSYEDKVGHRFDDSVFEDVIDRLKAKGYTMTMKEMFDGRDNMTDLTDDTDD